MGDNLLVDECWLADQGKRRKQADDSHELYFGEHPRKSDREYFEHVFHEVGKIPACQDLLAEGKTPLWAVAPSGDAAMKLLAFWREIDTDTGKLKRVLNHELHESHEFKPMGSAPKSHQLRRAERSPERELQFRKVVCGSSRFWVRHNATHR